MTTLNSGDNKNLPAQVNELASKFSTVFAHNAPVDMSGTIGDAPAAPPAPAPAAPSAPAPVAVPNLQEMYLLMQRIVAENTSLKRKLEAKDLEEDSNNSADESGSTGDSNSNEGDSDSEGEESDTDRDEADAQREAAEYLKEKTMLCCKCLCNTVSRNSDRNLCHLCERARKDSIRRKTLATQNKILRRQVDNQNTKAHLEFEASLRKQAKQLKRERREIEKSRKSSSYKKQKN